MKLQGKLKKEFSYSLSNSGRKSVDYLNGELTVKEKDELLVYLIEYYEQSPELLTKFFQDKSDNSILECSEQEKLENDFKGYVLSVF
jgi:hypothetical protein